jgi:hypothetical protein
MVSLRRFWPRGPLTWWLDSLALFLLTSILIAPLFRLRYSDKWPSIESTFIADARFLASHWPHPRWQPLWYLGTRFDYIYPPALRYGTAAIVRAWPKMQPARAYHIYIAFLYCLGIAGVYVLARAGMKSRGAAWLAAAATALLSPSFLLIPEIRRDAWLLVPHRLGVMVRYGEGPHLSAVAILGFALAASWLALERARPGWLAFAAISTALVVSHNFYGAAAMAIIFPILVWSHWVTRQDRRVWWYAAVIVGLSYGLTAFWLTPSYVGLTLDNMKFVSQPGNRWSIWVAIALGIAYLNLTDRWARGRKDRTWLVFLAGALLFTFVNVIGNYYLKFRIIGEPTRMVPELDVIIILAVVEGLRRLWALPKRTIRAAVVVFVLLTFNVSRHYVKRAWQIYIPEPEYQQRVEYRLQDWIAKNAPSSRAFVAGTIRFWYDAWNDLAQAGGGSEQGILNTIYMPAAWRIHYSQNLDDDLLWLPALGIDYIIVNDKTSQEWYHDYLEPQKFVGRLPVAFDDHQGNVIYRVPRRYEGLARVVDSERLDALPPSAEIPDPGYLRSWNDILEKGPGAPASTTWEGVDALRAHVRVDTGQSVIVLVSYDPSWRAYSAGRPVPIRKSQLGFIRLDPPPGEHDLLLVFEMPVENIVGWVVTSASVLIVAVLFWKTRRQA